MTPEPLAEPDDDGGWGGLHTTHRRVGSELVMKGLLVLSVLVVASVLAFSAFAVAEADAGSTSRHHCAGRIHFEGGEKFAWRIRAERMACRRAKSLIRRVAEHSGFRCVYREKQSGIRVKCTKRSDIGLRRFIYLVSSK